MSLKSNPAHKVAEPASIFANAVGLGSPRLSGEAKAAEHLAMMYGSNSKTLQHADSSKAILYPASEDFRSGGKLTDGYAE